MLCTSIESEMIETCSDSTTHPCRQTGGVFVFLFFRSFCTVPFFGDRFSQDKITGLKRTYYRAYFLSLFLSSHPLWAPVRTFRYIKDRQSLRLFLVACFYLFFFETVQRLQYMSRKERERGSFLCSSLLLWCRLESIRKHARVDRARWLTSAASSI